MAVELSPPEGLEHLGEFQDQLRGVLGALGLEAVQDMVLAGATAAWAAFLGAGGQGLSLSLLRAGPQLILELSCQGTGQGAAPAGLDPALFRPPALKAQWIPGNRPGGQARFSLVWEV